MTRLGCVAIAFAISVLSPVRCRARAIKVVAASFVVGLSLAVAGSSAFAQDPEDLAQAGSAIVAADSDASQLRALMPNAEAERGFDIGLAYAGSQTEWGPGKQRFGEGLPPGEQAGYFVAALFVVNRNANAQRIPIGAAIAGADAEIASAREHSDPRFRLGFDTATFMFGDPSKGAQGNVVMGPGAEGVRRALSKEAQAGFDQSMGANLARRGVPTPAPRIGVDPSRVSENATKDLGVKAVSDEDFCWAFAGKTVDARKRIRGLGCSGAEWNGPDGHIVLPAPTERGEFAGWCLLTRRQGDFSWAARTWANTEKTLAECLAAKGFVTTASCEKYAHAGVGAAIESRDLGCGGAGGRWTTDYNAHFDWCMGQPDTSAPDAEAAARAEALATCRESKQ